MKPIRGKFVLLFIPQPSKAGRRTPSLGLLAISTFLEKEGYDIRLVHAYDRESEEYTEIWDNLDKAICVGISSMTGYQILDGLKFAEFIRRKNKKVPIVWGGIHSTIKPLQTIQNPLVDIVVRGQGEETFHELVKTLEKGDDLKNIRGIVYKNKGKIIENLIRPAKDINEFPDLPYHLLDDNIEKYIKPNFYVNRYLPIITSEGCPFKCAFCYLAMSEFKKSWQAYPAKRVLDQIEYLVKKYNLTGVDIRDANFFVDKKRARDIFQGLIDRKLNHIALSGINGRVDQLIRYDDEFWKLMERAGVREILVGAESGDQSMLDLIGKGLRVEDILACEKKATNYNINIINSFMTGFPPADNNLKLRKKVLKKELNKTVELIVQIFNTNPLASILMFFYTPYPGTPLYELCLKQGFKDPESLEEWGGVDLSNRVTPWVNQSHKRKAYFLGNLFTLKKVTSSEFLRQKNNKNWKYYLMKYAGLAWLLNKWVTFRLKYKFYYFPFEILILK
jgi:anaerobic magnesium-protoporphyrin IX monomethyl ester cyclase